MRRARFVGPLLAISLAALAAPAAAQVPPTGAEAAAYTGLHAAAQRGDLAAIAQLAGDAREREARDAHRRTPLHVAAFARQPEAVRALLAAGADSAALEAGRYDAVASRILHEDEGIPGIRYLDGTSRGAGDGSIPTCGSCHGSPDAGYGSS